MPLVRSEIRPGLVKNWDSLFIDDMLAYPFFSTLLSLSTFFIVLLILCYRLQNTQYPCSSIITESLAALIIFRLLFQFLQTLKPFLLHLLCWTACSKNSGFSNSPLFVSLSCYCFVASLSHQNMCHVFCVHATLQSCLLIKKNIAELLRNFHLFCYPFFPENDKEKLIWILDVYGRCARRFGAPFVSKESY